MENGNIEGLQEYVKKCKTRLQKILQRLNWTEEGVLQNFNSNSLASTTATKTKKICSPKISTYPESCLTKNSIAIETPQLQDLLQNNQIKAPENFRDLQANFSREEKLKIYEHVIEHTEKLDNNTIPKVAEGEISLAEIVAQKKREEKCKKRKFRKSKPTHIEEVRSLVDLQMQALQQYIGNQIDHTKGERKKDKGRGEYKQRQRSRNRAPAGIEENKKNSYTNYRRNRSRSNEKFKRRRSKSRSIGRSNEFKYSKSPYCERRKRSVSRDWNTDGKSFKSKEVGNYQNKRSRTRSPNENSKRLKDYEKYRRRHSKSPQTSNYRDRHLNDRHPNERSKHKRNVYEHDRKSRRRSISREREKYYTQEERFKKYKERDFVKSYRQHSEDRDNKKSRHKSKKHKRDRS